jgi:hypothetical protein
MKADTQPVDPWSELAKPARLFIDQMRVVRGCQDQAWLQRVIDWPRTHKLIRRRARVRLDDLERAGRLL